MAFLLEPRNKTSDGFLGLLNPHQPIERSKVTAPINKPIPQEQLDKFKAYKAKNPTWGSLHHVLVNKNVGDKHVLQAMELACRHGDLTAYELGDNLLNMSKSQRHKIAKTVE